MGKGEHEVSPPLPIICPISEFVIKIEGIVNCNDFTPNTQPFHQISFHSREGEGMEWGVSFFMVCLYRNTVQEI